MSEDSNETWSYFDYLPIEIIDRIFLEALEASDFMFPRHACWTFNNLIETFPEFGLLKERYKQFLPRVYINTFATPLKLPRTH